VASNITSWFGPYSVGDAVEDVIDLGFAYLLSEPRQGDDDGFSGPNFDDFRKRSYTLRLQKAVEEVSGDIRYSSFLSTNDAMNEVTHSLNTDMWQTISKLGSLSGQIPEISLAFKSLISLVSGHSIDSIKEALDILTQIRLQHQFQWRPEFDLLTKQLPEISKVVSAIDKLSRTEDVVCRGTFHFDFPKGEFGREESRLVTRSRLVVGRNSFASLTNLLDLRALGVLPSPSVGWDLIPFSFVVNWFSGIGARIRDLETSAFVLSVDIKVFTHSYLITSPLLDDELALSGFSHSALPGSEPPMIRFYVREVSRHVPRIGVGRYDFRLPTRLPDWATAGSLAWQVLLSSSI
jgi:hypothetical protein